MSLAKKVAIVEDIEKIVENFERMLKYDNELELVGKYGDGESAIEGIALRKPDVVVLDIGLPGRYNGLDCLVILGQEYPDMKFLMYTQFDDDERLFRALELRAKGYILKEDGVPQMVRNVKDVLQGLGAMSGPIAAKVMEYHYNANKTVVEQSPKPYPPELEMLNETERMVLKLLSEGVKNPDVAIRMGLSKKYVRVVVSKIYDKTHIRNRIILSDYYRKLMGI